MTRTIKKIYFKIKNRIDIFLRKREIKKLALKSPCKIIVGSGGTDGDGWIPTEVWHLDLLKKSDWNNLFRTDSIDAILSEHVWEHLTESDGLIAIQNCYTFLKTNGYLRIAVPDGYHPSKDYIDYVKPGGHGSGADDHKVLYTHVTLSQLLESAGFSVKKLEYFDENGVFHFEEWDKETGMISRSSRYDERNLENNLSYTSLIIDGIKL
jgi:predicted SAM-dependent methyltransferase